MVLLLGFASFGFSSRMPPAEPALPVSVFGVVAAFLDRDCFAGTGVLVLVFGLGEEDLVAMM